MGNGTINTCGGTFYDSGGPAGNYANNSNLVQTICTDAGPGTCVQVHFTSFNTRNASDYLRIYDGSVSGVNLIGTYYGNLGAFSLPIVSSTGCLTFQFISNANTNRAGWEATITCVPCPPPPGSGSVLLHPSVGLQNTVVGACMQSTCNSTLYDDGGAGGNYSDNINNILWTICPDIAGNCVRATFHSFQVEAPGFFYYDYLTIRNGPTQQSPQFPGGSTFAGSCLSYAQCMGGGLGPFVSTDLSGCLTFSFRSDNTVNLPGWVTSIDCVPCANGPTGLTNADCSGTTPICSNTAFASVSTGPGLVSEACSGCSLGENYSNWFTFQAQTSGELHMTIDPVNNNDDFDFAIFGPNVTCQTLGSPIRCSVSSTTGNTGMNGTAVDLSEDVFGDGWVAALNVTAGETYRLMVNKWSAGGSGYTIDWSGSTASLDCSVLPVELLDFTANRVEDRVRLNWTTASEVNAASFRIEKADAGAEFRFLADAKASGNTNTLSQYELYDEKPVAGVQYYRLKQIDFNGQVYDLGITSLNFFEKYSLNIEQISIDEMGTILLVYDNGFKGNCRIQLSSSLGRVIYSKDVMSEAGRNFLEIPVPSIESSIVYVTIFNSLSTVSEKLLILD